MQSVVIITKALASEPRLRILMALRRRRVCESVLTEMLGLAPATVSKHLWLLQQAGLVDSEKTGRCVCYSLVSAEAGNAVSHTLRWLRECLAGNALVRGDAERTEILLNNSSVQRQCRQFRRRRARRLASRTAEPAKWQRQRG